LWAIADKVEIDHVVWDDGSSDLADLKRYEEEYPKATFHYGNKNVGPSVARNEAIKTTDSDFILPLDSDDYFSINAIRDLLRRHYESKGACPVYPTVQMFGKSDMLLTKPEWSKERVMKEFFIPCSSLITREAFDSVGGFTADMNFLEDFDLWVRLALAGYKGAYASTAILFYNIREDSRSDHFNLKKTLIEKARLKEEILRRNGALLI
jgi:GT2 family glycosyltransferase